MDLDIVYMAGFFDGEGYVGMNKRQRGKYTEYIIQMSVGQKDGAIVDWLKEKFGGTVHKVRRDGSYQWIATNRIAYRVLEQITPYLKYKKPQAEIALSFYDNLIQGSLISEEEKERRESIFLALKAAKKVFSQSTYYPNVAGTTTKRIDPKGM